MVNMMREHVAHYIITAAPSALSLRFAIVATLAALFPAFRATRVDPLVAIRNE